VSEVRNDPPGSVESKQELDTKEENTRNGTAVHHKDSKDNAAEVTKDETEASSMSAMDISMESMEGEVDSEGGEEEEEEYSDCDPNQFCEISMDSRLEVSIFTSILVSIWI
jgi:hypothetical protein